MQAARQEQSPKKPEAIKVFISYDRADEKLRGELQKNLTPLERESLITIWHNRNISAGTDWKQAIDEHLGASRIILLLISPDFVASDYLDSNEVKQALERHKKQTARVIPVILRPCDWESTSAGKLQLQPLPRNERPVTDWPKRDNAFLDIAKGIRAVVDELIKEPRAESDPPTLVIPPLLPPTAPHAIQQRSEVVKDVFAKLVQPEKSAIVLTGMGGVGKSTLAALVRNHAEEQRRVGAGPFTAEPLWLAVDATTTLAGIAKQLLHYLRKPMPDFSECSPQDLARVLSHALNTTDKPRLVILDEFEHLLDMQTGKALEGRPGVREWLDALNNEPCACKVLLTCRRWPAWRYARSYLEVYPVEGLKVEEGIEFLWKRGIEAPKADLKDAVERCGGHAQALELLASMLNYNPSLSLHSLLNDLAHRQLWKKEVAEELLNYIYTKQLNKAQQDLLSAFSIYREAVPWQAVQKITGRAPGDILSDINRVLLAQSLLQAVSDERYRLHPIVADYAQEHFDASSEQANQRARKEAHAKAAEYYKEPEANGYRPRQQRKDIDDVHPLIEAVWQQCQAERWQEAFRLMQMEGLFPDLKRWGEYVILLDLCKLLLPVDKWFADWQEAFITYYMGQLHDVLWQKQEALKRYSRALRLHQKELGGKDSRKIAELYNNIGSVYRALAEMQKALVSYQKALDIYRALRDTTGEIMALNNRGSMQAALGKPADALADFKQALKVCERVKDRRHRAVTRVLMGDVYAASGDDEKAQQEYEQGLSMYREVGDRRGEAETQNKLGIIYNSKGRKEEAQQCHEQALSIAQHIKDRGTEGEALNLLGEACAQKEKEKAQEYYEQALRIFREIGNRAGEGKALNNLGRICDDVGKKEDALKLYQAALDIFREVGDARRQGWVHNNRGIVYSAIGEKGEALTSWQEALRLLEEVEDSKGQGWVLNNLGNVYSDSGDEQQAQAYFRRAWNVCRKVGDRTGEATSLHNIGTCIFKQGQHELALACLLCARSIFDELHNARRDEVQKSVDALQNSLGKQQFNMLLAKVGLDSCQRVQQALS